MRENLETMQRTAEEVAQTVLESKAVVADIVMGADQPAANDAPAPKAKSPFKL